MVWPEALSAGAPTTFVSVAVKSLHNHDHNDVVHPRTDPRWSIGHQCKKPARGRTPASAEVPHHEARAFLCSVLLITVP